MTVGVASPSTLPLIGREERQTRFLISSSVEDFWRHRSVPYPRKPTVSPHPDGIGQSRETPLSQTSKGTGSSSKSTSNPTMTVDLV